MHNSASCPAKYIGRGVATPEVSKALFLMSEESLTGLRTHKMGANGQVSLQSAVTYVPEYQKNTDSVKVLSPDPTYPVQIRHRICTLGTIFAMVNTLL